MKLTPLALVPLALLGCPAEVPIWPGTSIDAAPRTDGVAEPDRMAVDRRGPDPWSADKPAPDHAVPDAHVDARSVDQTDPDTSSHDRPRSDSVVGDHSPADHTAGDGHADRAVHDSAIDPDHPVSDIPPTDATHDAGAPPECSISPTGDWTITTSIGLVDCELTVMGNITIQAGGSLTLTRARLTIASQERAGFRVTVEAGGGLHPDASTVTGPEDRFFSVQVLEGASFSMLGSTLENAGWKDQTEEGPTSEKYLDWHWVGPNFTKDFTLEGHGLEIHVPVGAGTFTGNTLRNNASIRFHADGNVVTGNTVIRPRHEGLAFFGNDNEVSSNVVHQAPALYRESYGIRFYPATTNNEIHHNQISDVTHGIGVGQIPPWTVGEGFFIHHNVVERVHVGAAVAIANSTIADETYRHIGSHGLALGGMAHHVTIERCLIEDVTHVIPELYTYAYYDEVKDQVHATYPRTYYDFGLRRGALLLAWNADDVIIADNTFRRIPFHGYGIGADLPEFSVNITIAGNTFEHIGDASYLETPGVPVDPYVGSIALSSVSEPSGGAIELETTDNVHIVGNIFRDCLNGIVTDFPDAIGHSGSVEIATNDMLGLGTLAVENWGWASAIPREWIYSQRMTTQETSKAILLSVRLHGLPAVDTPRRAYLEQDATFDISDNIIGGWYYPIAIDPSTYYPEAPKDLTTVITGNTISDYTEFYLPGYDMEALFADNTIE